jgi:hypothetical protein
MDETWLKPFCPYNTILVAQFGKKVEGNISTCENLNFGFLGVFLSKGNLPLLEVTS